MHELTCLSTCHISQVGSIRLVNTATSLQRQRTTIHDNGAVALQALRAVGSRGECQRSVFNVDVTAVLVLMVGGFARVGGAVQLSLNSIVANTTHAHGSTAHEEILIGMDTVFHGFQHIDGAILHRHVFASLNGMCGQSVDVQHTVSLELSMSLDHETSLLRAVGTVGQRILCVFFHAHINALAILNVDGCTTGIGQRHSVQFQCCLIRARHVEASIGGPSTQCISDFAGYIGTLGYADMGTRHAYSHVAGYVASYEDLS